MKQNIEDVVAEMSDAIEAADEALIMGVAGVVHSMTDLRTALSSLDSLLSQRRFEKAASLGYRDISSNYVFLQRTLGALQKADDNKAKIIQDVAMKTQLPYEEAAPFVDRLMESSIPRGPTTTLRGD